MLPGQGGGASPRPVLQAGAGVAQALAAAQSGLRAGSGAWWGLWKCLGPVGDYSSWHAAWQAGTTSPVVQWACLGTAPLGARPLLLVARHHYGATVGAGVLGLCELCYPCGSSVPASERQQPQPGLQWGDREPESGMSGQ